MSKKSMLARENFEHFRSGLGDSMFSTVLGGLNKADDLSEEGKLDIKKKMRQAFNGTADAHVFTFAKGHLDLLSRGTQKTDLEKSRFQMEKTRKFLQDRPGQRGFFS